MFEVIFRSRFVLWTTSFLPDWLRWCIIAKSKLVDSSGLDYWWKHLGLCEHLNRIYNKALVIFRHFNAEMLFSSMHYLIRYTKLYVMALFISVIVQSLSFNQVNSCQLILFCLAQVMRFNQQPTFQEIPVFLCSVKLRLSLRENSQMLQYNKGCYCIPALC